MDVTGLARLGHCVRAFYADRSGSASVEFIVSLPLLIGVLVLSAEYGRAMLAREALDSATSAAVRLLGRSPADPSSSCTTAPDADGNPVTTVTQLVLYQDFIDEARALIAERTGLPEASVNLADPVITAPDPQGIAYRSTFFRIELDVQATVDLSLLSLLDFYDKSGDARTPTGLTLNARDTARWVGPVPVCAQACTFVAEAAGECTGAS